LMFFIFV